MTAASIAATILARYSLTKKEQDVLQARLETYLHLHSGELLEKALEKLMHTWGYTKAKCFV